MFDNKKVLITGGTGFLGRGILRRATQESWDCDITVYSRDETKQDQCKRRYPHVRYLLGDVRDPDRLETALSGHDVVIHAAAVKFIPEAEYNVSECIDVNVQGTSNVLRAARRQGVERVVCLSTDKAVQPVNTYGMTKALLERLVSEDVHGDTQVTAVRYGNVVGSTGSVIPLFEEQLRTKGFVSLTNCDMTRYWLSIDEAVDLIGLASLTLTRRIIIPELKAMTMGNLAEALAGPDKINVIGLRPGEKMHESLLHEQESLRAVSALNEAYFILHPPGHAPVRDRPFALTSQGPDDFLSKEDMLVMIEDAKHV